MESVASVKDFISLRPVCSQACADAGSYATGRDITPGSNGFSSAPQVEARIAAQRAAGAAGPEDMLSAVADEFEMYALGPLSFEDGE